MALSPKIKLSLTNKCDKVSLKENTGVLTAGNLGGWGPANIGTTSITYADVKVVPYNSTVIPTAVGTGTIVGTTFTDVTHTSGVFMVGQYLTGPGVTPGTKITALLTGTGSNNGGTYQVNIAQSVTSTTITGQTLNALFILKNSSVDYYLGVPGAPYPAEFTILADQTWSNPDGIYKVTYTVLSGAVTYETTTVDLFLCNLCACKDELVVKLLKSCDAPETEKLKVSVDQMEIFIYGIESAFACGDFTTASSLLATAAEYCQTISDCGCGCGGC